MWQRFSLYDFRVIGHYLGVLIMLTGAVMLIPFALGMALHEWEPAARFLKSAGFALLLGSALRMLRVAPGRLSRLQAVAITSIAWVAVALVAAVPFLLSGNYQNYFDCFFEAVSLTTTTGVSLVSGVDHLSYADNMWRYVLVYAGGLGLVVVAMSFGLFGRVANSSLYESEGRSDHVLPNVVETARFIFKFSGAVILVAGVVLFAVLALRGFEPLRAGLHGLWLAVASFMTVGLTPMSTSVSYYHSLAVEVVLMLLMVLGCLNFTLQSEVLRGNVASFFRDYETRVGALWVLAIFVVFVAALVGSTQLGQLPTMLRTGLFNFVAAFTTCGLTTLTSNQLVVALPSGALLVMAIAMAVGGCSGSTAGGIKLRRVAIIAKSAFETMKSAASTQSARVVSNYYHIGKRRLDEGEVKEAMTVFILFVIMYIVGALVGVAMGYDAVSAIMESVAMASNGGISAGIVSAATPMALKGVYILEMWAGRLEFVTLIAMGIKVFVSLKPRRLRLRRRG